MLSHEDNELLTRVGPGTPMGDDREVLAAVWAGFGAAQPDRLPAGSRSSARSWWRSVTRAVVRPGSGELPASRRVAVLRSQ